ncbi:calmodulin-binding transcription activator 2 isoform X2 [Ahaetulla prasina]|uniref:calmodulin-binding transcription activator 2 isoform X2 n=1 Tax=Ahaetulla prasina TaxID=499056 RepID=UPI0026478C10|nr:calmodulin-binding transcription activator 2 isoform X2 [Ahaetulla prasina]
MNKAATEVSENSHHLKVFLPKKLVECVPKCPALPKERLRWNTNEEIASYLITFEKHEEWLSGSPKTRPQNGSLILYNRKKVKYRKDGYCWKKRKDGKTTREDHMKLKVKGVECLYGCYVHSSIVPTFHRRCYWLLQNPDIVLVHYLNVPAIEDCGKICSPILCSINSDRKEWLKWSKEELVGQLKPMWSPGHVPHKCNSIKHRIISPKVDVRPCPFPALTEVQNISGSPEARAEVDLAKGPLLDSKGPKPAKPGSPTMADAIPDSTQPSPALARPGGFPKQERPPGTLSVSLPGSTIFVMAGPSGAEKPLALTPSQHLVSGEGGVAPTASLGLAVLPGLVLSQSLESAMETNEGASDAFDPDRFLNSPKQGQTYGGGPGLQAEPEPTENAPASGYSLYISTNRFFIQDDGAGQGPTPLSASPTVVAAEAKSSTEAPMETAGEGDSRAEVLPVEAGGEAGGVPEISPKELQEELYSVIQRVAAAAAGGPFGLSFDSHFPDLISELMTEGTVANGAGSPNGPSPGSGSPEPVLPETLAEPCYAAEAVLGCSAQPLVSITDFSPEWSYPEGGVKVLITGPWMDDSESYSCLFDQISVPAALIQSGVLRCYCPAHEAGLVPLQVAHDSCLLSPSVLFEYRARNFLALPSTQLDWLSLDDNQFKMSILERLEQMEKRVAEMAASASHGPQAEPQGEKPPGQAASDSFEERIVAVCEKMMLSQSWLRSETLVHHVSFRGMTLLHLAAAQGYTHLIETLIKWRSLNAQNLDLEQEVDPLNVDHFSCTPLMWACALGHLEAARLLYRWNSQALAIPDSLGRLPLTVARSRGHVKLATCLEELQHQEEAVSEPLEPLADASGSAGKACIVGLQHPTEGLQIPSPLSASPDTGLSTASGVSSPSERSEGSLSVTSAYSSGSALRESPAYSPEAEGAMDVCQGLPPSSLEGWYLQEAASPPSLPPASFFLSYGEGGSVGPPGGPEAQLEPELLAYGENAENEEQLPETDVLQVDVITLAKQIIEATPERIKQEDFGCVEAPLRERSSNVGLNETMSWLASYLENVDQLPSLPQRRGLAPSPPGRSCLSPLQSPLADLSFERLPPPPTAASWAEFLNASGNGKMESDFALLTLSDHEQRELYEAARIIQTAFRKYKGRRLKEQQELAAAVIQRCYRKYKQYALYKKMTQAAILIQSKFRSYYEQKKFRQSRRAAVLIQQYYRSYKEYERLKQGHRTSAAMQQKIKGTFLTKKQDQAARKIMRFLRRCRHRMKELKQRQEMETPPQKRGMAT